jgi:fatty-acyl-CoA synthase
MARRWVELTTLGDTLTKGATESPEREALVLEDERSSYSALHSKARDYARSLYSLGLRQGDSVGILMNNSVDFVATLFASSFIGCTVVPLNARFRSKELGYAIRDSGVKAIVTSSKSDEYVDYAGRLYETLPGLLEAKASHARTP